MRGSRALVLLGGAAIVAIAFQRGRSPFLRIEAEADLAREVARGVGLDVLDVMALRELIGVDVTGEELLGRARAFAADRAAFGSEALAAVAAAGHRGLAEVLLRDAEGDPGRAERLLRAMPEAVTAVRMRSVRARFADRRS